jgi:hypothetical protein
MVVQRRRPAWKTEYGRKHKTMESAIERAKSDVRKRLQSELFAHNRKEHFESKRYLHTVQHLVCHWKESTDGVVVGLWYDQKKKKFVAKMCYLHGPKSDDIHEEIFDVSDEWVFDNYGSELASKLINQEEGNQFSDLPEASNGTLGSFLVDNKKIWKVRFLPQVGKTKVDGEEDKDPVTTVIPERW